ncbi:putative wall-associated receptor kinase [Trifolium repens]|nr:putative wall-associated receptor kinase [Trifolium repens]
MLTRVSRYCNNTNYRQSTLKLNSIGFSVSSSENKFITIGCDTYGFINSIYKGEKYTTGCLTRCNGNRNKIENGTCSGIGCCQVDIPHMMKNISRHVAEFPNSTEPYGCSYSFIVKDGSYNFSVSHLDDFPYERLPLIVDWNVGNKSCKASMVEDDYACKNNSVCYDQGCQNRDFTLNRKRIVRSKNRKSQPKSVDSTQIVLLNRKGKSRSHNRKSQSKSMDSTHLISMVLLVVPLVGINSASKSAII